VQGDAHVALLAPSCWLWLVRGDFHCEALHSAPPLLIAIGSALRCEARAHTPLVRASLALLVVVGEVSDKATGEVRVDQLLLRWRLMLGLAWS